MVDAPSEESRFTQAELQRFGAHRGSEEGWGPRKCNSRRNRMHELLLKRASLVKGLGTELPSSGEVLEWGETPRSHNGRVLRVIEPFNFGQDQLRLIALFRFHEEGPVLPQRSEVGRMAPTDHCCQFMDSPAHPLVRVFRIAALPVRVAEQKFDVSDWETSVRIIFMRDL
jgi:hypothetical protein